MSGAGETVGTYCQVWGCHRHGGHYCRKCRLFLCRDHYYAGHVR